MGEEIGFHEDVIHFFNRYLQTRPAELPVILGRIIREFYCTGIKEWIENPKLIPKYSKDKGDKINIKQDGRIPYQRIPESRKQKIMLNTEIAKTYRNFCDRIGLNPDDNATYQCRLFIKMFQLKRMESLNKKRDMEKLQPK